MVFLRGQGFALGCIGWNRSRGRRAHLVRAFTASMLMVAQPLSIEVAMMMWDWAPATRSSARSTGDSICDCLLLLLDAGRPGMIVAAQDSGFSRLLLFYAKSFVSGATDLCEMILLMI